MDSCSGTGRLKLLLRSMMPSSRRRYVSSSAVQFRSHSQYKQVTKALEYQVRQMKNTTDDSNEDKTNNNACAANPDLHGDDDELLDFSSF